MSKITSILEVRQPSQLHYANQNEVLKMAQECENCSGQGGRYIDSRSPFFVIEVGEHYEACKVCKGTGYLEANIVIGWKPYGKVKEQFKTSKIMKTIRKEDTVPGK